ncbi:hypothetical protein PGT21_016090 [Puccinia graminis f. sp. tritici]|uniref:Uncharacterized protein n=1 Tax=Puccinia graminis f. sp. tritici TaxID=56615 RepID=A0A5B0NFU3_PUCGR|nr:hypothetical protein PGT21_016090 [Puccinia graminis f. sp. tritici]
MSYQQITWGPTQTTVAGVTPLNTSPLFAQTTTALCHPSVTNHVLPTARPTTCTEPHIAAATICTPSGQHLSPLTGQKLWPPSNQLLQARTTTAQLQWPQTAQQLWPPTGQQLWPTTEKQLSARTTTNQKLWSPTSQRQWSTTSHHLWPPSIRLLWFPTDQQLPHTYGLELTRNYDTNIYGVLPPNNIFQPMIDPIQDPGNNYHIAAGNHCSVLPVANHRAPSVLSHPSQPTNMNTTRVSNNVHNPLSNQDHTHWTNDYNYAATPGSADPICPTLPLPPRHISSLLVV